MRFFEFFFLIIFAIASTTVDASCCDGESKIPWKLKNEILMYHSCGCADACWVAEVRNKKTGSVKIRLRSNCEKIFQKVGSQSEQEFKGDPEPFFSMQKFDAISKIMHDLSKQKSNHESKSLFKRVD
jgi:hypothetical protein